MLLLALAGLSLIWVFLEILKRRNSSRHLPPGPPANPFFGHLLVIPRLNQEVAYYKWGKQYGDVTHFNILGKSLVVLNSVQAATDLLEKRSQIYSDRPRLPVFELMGWMPSLTMLPYGKQFNLHRKILHQHLNRNHCKTYESIQTREAHTLVQNLILNPAERDELLGRFSMSVIIEIAYGHRITSSKDWYLSVARDASLALFETGTPGSTLIDAFPALQHFPSWFPGTYYANFARSNRHRIRKLFEVPVQNIQEQMARGDAPPSFVRSLLEKLEQEDSDLTLSDVQGAAAILHVAGTDSTWASLSIFFLSMILHPECQTKAQAEIDTVIGSDRLPKFSDRPSLPYTECLLQETLRWHQATPLGLPHRSLVDDYYKGMFIPKGSLIFANSRGMTLDEDIYEDPFKFFPDRYLPKPEGNGEPHPSAVFGWGRRVCPGRHFADANLWIAITTILATLDISKATDSSGNEITPVPEFSPGLVAQPVPYECTIKPRNQTMELLIA